MEARKLFNSRLICIIAIGLAAGVLINTRFSGSLLFAALTAALAVAAYAAKRRTAALLLLALTVGFTRMEMTAPPTFAEGRYALCGTVCEAPECEGGEIVLLLENVSLSGTKLGGKAKLTLAGETLVVLPVPGQDVSAKASVSALPENAYYERRLGIMADCTARADEAVFGVPRETFMAILCRMREGLRLRIDTLFPNSDGLARAMLLGDKRTLTKTASDALYGAGVGHLIAVSGLHVGILALALSKLLPVRRAKLRFLLLTAFLASYALVTALSPSVLRAGLMLCCLEGAFLFDRRRDLLTSLAFAAAVILFVSPASLLTASFQLSFLAICGFITVYEPMKKALAPLGEKGAKILSASASATLSTFPASAAFFGDVSPVAIAVNCVVLPLAPCFLVPAAAAVALSYVYLPLAELVALPARLALLILSESARLFSAEALLCPAPGPAAFLLYLLALLAASPLVLRPAKERYTAALALLSLSLLCWLFRAIP